MNSVRISGARGRGGTLLSAWTEHRHGPEPAGICLASAPPLSGIYQAARGQGTVNEWHHLALIFGLWVQGGCSQQAPGTCSEHKGTELSNQSTYLGTGTVSQRGNKRGAMLCQMAEPALPAGAFCKSVPHLTLEGTGRSQQEVQHSVGPS